MIHLATVQILAGAMSAEIIQCENWAKERQTCKRKAVGVTIISPNLDGSFTTLIRTHNGPSAEGHECSNIVGGCGCSHSEPRAIFDCMRGGWLSRGMTRKLILLCTYSPCTNCANVINDSAIISGVVYRELTQHDPRGVDLLVKNDLDVVTVDDLLHGRKDDLITKWR